MAIDMVNQVDRGRTDVKDVLKKATDDIQRMGDEYQEVKTGLSDMPGGLDADLAAMIADAKDQGKGDAAAEIEKLESSKVADAKSVADSIKTDVTQKISDNTTAKSKIEGISSKYGKAARDRAVTALDQNNTTGNDLLKMLDDAKENADQVIREVKGRL